MLLVALSGWIASTLLHHLSKCFERSGVVLFGDFVGERAKVVEEKVLEFHEFVFLASEIWDVCL